MGEKKDELRDEIEDSGGAATVTTGTLNRRLDDVLDVIEEEVEDLRKIAREVDPGAMADEGGAPISIVSYGVQKENGNTYLDVRLRLD